MFKHIFLAVLIVAVTAKPHWHSINHGQAHSHGQSFNHGHSHGNGHGHHDSSSGSQSQSGSAQQFINSNGCGHPTITPMSTYIVGGVEATAHSWPWMASLHSSYHFCGGSLITNQHILTAAHCVDKDKPGSITVKLGKHDLTKVESGQVNSSVSEIYLHANYNKRTSEHDIAILVLSHPVTYTDNIKHVCIDESFIKDGTVCTTTGWGSGYSGGPTINQLNQVQLPIIQNCSAYLGGEYYNDSMVCAGYPQGGKDSCQGDSGGPLMHQIGSSWYISGLTSWGYGCALPNYPGVYTRVSHYITWIKDFLSSS